MRKYILKHTQMTNTFDTKIISGASLDQLEKFQDSSTLPNIEYNCTILFGVKCIGHLCVLQNNFAHRLQL